MNRVVKFRLWSKVDKCFIPIDLTDVQMMEIRVCASTSDPDCNWILQQFTGLKDKDDKDIYEGDWLVFTVPEGYEEAGSTYKTSVVFHNGRFVSYLKPSNVFVSGQTRNLYHYELWDKKSIKVEGNILENPYKGRNRVIY